MNIRQRLFAIGEAHYYSALSRELFGMRTVLDLGCGAASPLSNVEKNFYSIGYDIFAPSIRKSKEAGIHDRYIRADVLRVDEVFKHEKVDAVVALDLIEHLPKTEGVLLLKKLDRVAKRKIILLTPNGFTHQDPYENNPYQVHKSGWTREEFESSGYKVFGMRGAKWIRGECASIRYRPWAIWGTVSLLSQLVTYHIPEFSYQLLAVKELDAN